MRFSALAALLLGIVTVTSAQARAQSTTPWEYEGRRGALAWGSLDPAYRTCETGHEQSPIDIRKAHLNKSLKPIKFHYLAGPVTEVNNGHTVLVKVGPGSYIVVNGVRYNLVEFDFHHPSETAVNGKLTEMEVQLVHKSAKGKIVIIAVRMAENVNSPNTIIAMLWQHLPKTAGSSEKVTSMVNPGGLLPADRGYWTYMGSLSTPPCTEGVRWFVLEQPITVSRNQWRMFAQLFRYNSRPLQDLHGRRIEADE